MRKRGMLLILTLLGMAGWVPCAGATEMKSTAGVVAETAKAAAFACQGRVVKASVKPTKKSEESKPTDAEARKPESYLAWSCRTQSAAQKALNGLYIPAPDAGPAALEDAMRQSAQINRAVGQAMDMNCSCSFDPHNAKTNKPMVTCSCTGAYKEPKSGDR